MKLFMMMIALLSVFNLSLAKEVTGKAKKKGYQRPYGMAGCGLGSLAVNKYDMQIFAATTNGTSSNQYFGISSGTSNCVDDSTSEVADRMDHYINGNQNQLASEVAKGSGETIQGLAQLMGCQETSLLGKALKSNYQEIFQKNVTANIVTDNIITVILNDENLSHQCQVAI